MTIRDLTNVEIIYNEDLKNKLLIKIPHTKYHLLATYKKSTQKWSILALELTSTKRKLVAKEVMGRIMDDLVHNIIKQKNNINFKNKTNIKEIITTLKTYIENRKKIIKNNGIQ